MASSPCRAEVPSQPVGRAALVVRGRFGSNARDSHLINNRQNGRRRGRGGGGGGPRQGGQGQRDSGNRIDSRARGNAAQLLEKYRNMARDAQLSGDRVNTEYYLQFADHYFRVLADQRGRSEEQGQQQRRQRDDFDQFDLDDDFGDEGEIARADEQPRGEERPRDDDRQRDYQRDDRPRGDRNRDDRQRDDRQRDGNRDRRDEVRQQPAVAPANDLDNDEAEVAAAAEEQPRRRRGRKPREAVDGNVAEANGGMQGIEADRLPPALGAQAAMEGVPGVEGEIVSEDAPRPRRRRTRAAAEATSG